jgi:hypothetical protein
MLTVLFTLFAAYILYRLVFHFIIPIWRTTRQVKRSFREMQERMNSQMQGREQPHPSSQVNTASTKASKQGDYIDFEEVKE